MPVKLTDKVDAERKLYKDSQGTIYGWTLDEACEHEEIPGEGEYLMSHLPQIVYIHFLLRSGKSEHYPPVYIRCDEKVLYGM